MDDHGRRAAPGPRLHAVRGDGGHRAAGDRARPGCSGGARRRTRRSDVTGRHVRAERLNREAWLVRASGARGDGPLAEA
ncbi:hypothetical protein Cus16_0784 [Curtobacterium sp. ER1/6]|nr:hypothetical protein Cus16_0784 [Curtobacterium sp. ER1/6]